MTEPIKVAYETFKAKDNEYSMLYRYYDGDQPLKYSTDRLARAFDNVHTYFAQNWCSVVVDSVVDRLNLKGFDVGGAKDAMEGLFKRLHLELDAYDVHEAAEITGEAYLIVDVVDGEIEAYYNDPRFTMVQYNHERPKFKDWAAKQWDDEEEKSHITIYYTDRIEDWQAGKKPASWRSYRLADTTENVMPSIPVFHFRVSRRTGKRGLDKSTISVQDAINKLLSDMMVAAEYEAFKMRIFISQQDPGNVDIGPDMKLWMPAREGKDGQDTSVVELGGSTLENFYKPMGELAAGLSATTKTPKHFFFNVGSVPSGEALIAMEAPLNKKVTKRQENYAVTWQEFAKFILEIAGIDVGEQDITPIWSPIETVQPLTSAQILQVETSAGVPLKVAAMRQGWGEDEIAELPDEVSEPDQPETKGAIPE